MGRNTAPAIALAALALDENDVMLVSPSYHHIVDTQAFQDAAQAAGKLASDDWLVAFGIAATAPETGYGYIRRGDPLGEGHQVHSFVEKPDLETALGFLAQGGYAWNGGIFAFRAGFFLSELTKYRPDMAAAARAAFEQRDPEPRHSSGGHAIRHDRVRICRLCTDGEHRSRSHGRCLDGLVGYRHWDAPVTAQSPDADTVIAVLGNHRRKRFDDRQLRSLCHLIGTDDIVVVVDRDDVLVTSRNAVQRVGEASRCKKP